MILFSLLFSYPANAQMSLRDCNITWTTQSVSATESMPCGGGSIGLNIWTENNEILFYIARSGSFDENNALLKAGRIRLKLSPNPFADSFQQTLDLPSGSVVISGKNGRQTTTITCRVDVFQPVIYLQVNSSRPVAAEATYENWRFKDRSGNGRANFGTSYKWTSHLPVVTRKDSVGFDDNSVLFFHRNRNENTIFDVAVQQQGLDSVKQQLFNPLYNLTFGGVMHGSAMKAAGMVSGKYADTEFRGWKLATAKPAKKITLTVALHTAQAPTIDDWKKTLAATVAATRPKMAAQKTLAWWKSFWQRSFVFIHPLDNDTTSPSWQAGRNYQLFRYMLACNAYGDYPTRFNGGLFTYDPSGVDSSQTHTPDYRNWGGGVFTAQNQRLVYFPFLKNGDADLMIPQFEFYNRLLRNAELRSNVYWQHGGASFTEQMENFGLPNPAEYGWKRPSYFDKGVEYNAWLEYLWDTVLEFCLMILESERYAGTNISAYVPLIESCLRFFDQHYQYRAKHRGIKPLDENGQLVLYPGSAGETYKMATNATSTVAGLRVVTERLLQLSPAYLTDKKRASLDSFLRRIPPLPLNKIDGKIMLAPAKNWERINNTESIQLYPVYPWGLYGIGRPNLSVARNTWHYDTTALKFRSHIGWKQDNIFAARLGLIDEAAALTTLKLRNSGRRFPAFWGPGFDWTPDHNWGGSGMIGLQEMLLQTVDEKIYLFPAWPKEWNVHFKLHAPYQTTVEGKVINGTLEELTVIPAERKKDVINLLTQQIEIIVE